MAQPRSLDALSVDGTVIVHDHFHGVLVPVSVHIDRLIAVRQQLSPEQKKSPTNAHGTETHAMSNMPMPAIGNPSNWTPSACLSCASVTINR